MSLTTTRSVNVRISGRVQGVYFRSWAVETATELGLNGWVRNRRDTTVEMVLSGDADAVSAMIEKLHHGPPAARVKEVTVRELDEAPPEGFRERTTL